MTGPGSDSVEAPSVAIGELPVKHGATQGMVPRHQAFQAVATAFVVLFWIVGVSLWGLPFFYDFMVQHFGWTRAQVTSGNALSKLVVGPIFGFLAGWVIDRFGPRRMMMIGIVMAAAALIGLGRISSLGMFYFFYFFNALGYVCGGPLPNQVLLTRSFDRSRGKAMGFAYLGIGIGGATVPWISHLLVQHFGWQTALQILGLLIVVVSFPLAALLKEPPRASRTSVVEPATPKTAFRTASFYLLTLGSMCSIAAVSGTQQNLKLFLSLDRHFTQSEAAGILSLVLAFSIAGRLLMGWLADRFSKKYVMLLTYLLVAAGIPLLFLAGNSRLLLWISAAIFGVGLGGDYMIVPLMTADIFGTEILGRLLGVIVIAGGIAEALAPWAVGRLRDITGSYLIACFALVGVALLGGLAVLGLPERRRAA
jgi:MFS family permease